MKNLDVTVLNQILEKYSVKIEEFLNHFDFSGDVDMKDIISYLNNIQEQNQQKKEEFDIERKSYLKDMIKQNDERNREILPLININQDDEYLRISMVAPGLKKENISVKVEDCALIVKGVYDPKKDVKVQVNKHEFKLVNFKKEIELDHNVDINTIVADYKDGLLSILIKKIPPVSVSKDIDVQF